MDLFPREFVMELSTKNMGNSPSLLTNTHMTLSAKRFRSYRILTVDAAAEFCFWTEQRQNGSSHFHIGLAETPKVPNTIWEDKYLSFPMVHRTALNDW
jgi:hypothetical protein